VLLRVHITVTSAPSATVLTVTPPSQTEQRISVVRLLKEQGKMSLVLSIIEPYSDNLFNPVTISLSSCMVYETSFEKLTTNKLQLRHDHGYYYQCQLQMFVTRRLFL